MVIKDISLDTPEENILYDEALLYLAEKQRGDACIRFWESDQPFIVLGRVSQLDADVHQPAVARDRIPVIRRSSGGGTVLQGKGCLNYTLVLSKHSHPDLADLKKSYVYILQGVSNVLKNMGVAADYFPISDIALTDSRKKISGNAQRRLKHFILHHGTILYDFDLSLIARFLKLPLKQPAYRKKRTHADFVSNAPVRSIKAFKAMLAEYFGGQKEERSPTREERQWIRERKGKSILC
jgi:lipoate-protein ligase A